MRYLIAVLMAATLASPPLLAQSPEGTEEVIVIGAQETRIYELAETVAIEPDSAALLRKAVGANVISNGPISGIAQYRGMSRYRISSQINGAIISPGGPNWMDTPLSYAPAAHLHSLEVYRGIAPVSAGLETIGGVVNANTWSGEFADSGLRQSGRVRTGAQSVNDGTLLSGAFVVANEHHRLKLSGLSESADDAKFGGGDIAPTQYERDRVDIGYGWQAGRHSVQFDVGVSDTGDAGTPALPMDIQFIDAFLAGSAYRYEGDVLTLNSRLYYSEIDHGMTNYHLRQAPPRPGLYRRNTTDAESLGFALVGTVANWTLGLEGHNELHNSDIDNPNAAQFFVENFAHAERRIVSLFVEHELNVATDVYAELGVRLNHVTMDARAVDATPARMGMPPAVALRDTFNAAGRKVTDDNIDWAAKIYYAQNADTTWYAGAARKTRSPSYQERYLWLPLQATGGLADGRTYTGNVDLAPEVAHEVELGVDWVRGGLTLSPRVFYRDIDDYIQGTTSGNMSAVMFVRMMNMMNGTANAEPLEFNNVPATFYGVDVDWQYRLDERWSVGGVLNYVRAERDDIDDNLYRVAPPNALVTVEYAAPSWGASVDTYLYAKQDDVSATNGELPSAGYGLVNLHGYWRISDRLRLGLGIDNVADRDYRPHLGGVNRVRGNPAIAAGERLPGYGRGGFARIDYEW